MNIQELNPKNHFKFAYIDISNDLIWNGHVVDLNVAAEKKLGILLMFCILFEDVNKLFSCECYYWLLAQSYTIFLAIFFTFSSVQVNILINYQ